MQWSSILTVVSAALAASAMPSSFLVQEKGDALHRETVLSQFGEIVSTPVASSDEGDGEFFVYLDEDSGVDESMFDDWKNLVVNSHNKFRSKYGAPNLSWSDALYPGTQQWAKQCKFQHSQGNGKYGENLAAGTGNAYGFSNGLQDWMNEASKYDYNHPGFSSATGHFTQVVWKSSKQVACAIANCGPGTIFGQPSKMIVCRYSPAGNVIGHFPENVGRPR
ncbi:CAP domain-containing protein [Irpex rosettiformis]|uniref:CAP domain-containing protein n=1 Tax=Irpex rosettiformis TaxID=378272 RepID=A0ACB8TVJ7_9APHY|nr:CAP domain-containing protein [Irpex rosettiformis]